MADVLVRTAVENWQPRFCANGVDPCDYAHITGAIERWDDWCAAWCDGGELHLGLAAASGAVGAARSAGEAYARAATYFHFAQFLFVHDLAQARAAHHRALEALDAALPLLTPTATRHAVPFEGSTLAGVLRTPPGDGPHPTVLLVAGLDSTKEEFREVERAFLERGLATFAFDGPGQGEGEVFAARPDWAQVGAAVLTYVSALADVDATRVGVWGVSLGGYYAARMASAGLPIAATIALSGPYDLAASWDGLNPLTRDAFRVRAGCATPEDARLRSRDFTLAGHAPTITSPLLVIMGARDRLFSYHDAERLVAEASGPSELWLLEKGNHGCANVIYSHRPQSADWMARQLHATSSPPTDEGRGDG